MILPKEFMKEYIYKKMKVNQEKTEKLNKRIKKNNKRNKKKNEKIILKK